MSGRYARQTLFPGIGEEGQKKLGNSTVVIIGCGALGTTVATALVRAGVGRIRIIDRDFIEDHNLQRQILFDENDIKKQLPKAIAAQRHLQKVNSTVEIEGLVADVNHTNIEKLVQGASLVLDGLDNLETRFLINDVSLKQKIPWIYGSAISSYGMSMNIIPGQTACLRCLYPKIPGPGKLLTCDTAGIINTIPFIIGSFQATEALKLLVGKKEANSELIFIDAWERTFESYKINPAPNCPACSGKYEFLEGNFSSKTTLLCGQNAVQLINPGTEKVSFGELKERLKKVGEVSGNEFILRFAVDSHEMVIFSDGRAIIKNTTDETQARALYAKYIGR